jgi:hypothetical protein
VWRPRHGIRTIVAAAPWYSHHSFLASQPSRAVKFLARPGDCPPSWRVTVYGISHQHRNFFRLAEGFSVHSDSDQSRIRARRLIGTRFAESSNGSDTRSKYPLSPKGFGFFSVWKGRRAGLSIVLEYAACLFGWRRKCDLLRVPVLTRQLLLRSDNDEGNVYAS